MTLLTPAQLSAALETIAQHLHGDTELAALQAVEEHIERQQAGIQWAETRIGDMNDAIAGVIAQRDRYRDIIVALEQELAGEEYVPEDLSGLGDDELHARFRHPLFEYETTTSPRKSGISVVPEGDGWEPNDIIDTGADENGNPYPRRNWERFEYHEEEHWRRRKTVPPVAVPAPAADRTLDRLLGYEVQG